MKIENNNRESNFNVFVISAIFFILGVASLYYSISVTVDLMSYIMEQGDVVVFDKAGFYFYGVSIVLLVFPFLVVYKKIFKRTVSGRNEAWLNYTLLLGVVLMLVIPHALSFYTDSFAQKNNYIICNNEADKSLFTTSMVYVKNRSCVFE